MYLSYSNRELRDSCNTLDYNITEFPFSVREMVQIRSYLADLRSAPNLSEVPIEFDLNGVNLNVHFENIIIKCLVLSLLQNPTPIQVTRVKILEIIKIDLQISEIKNNL